MISKYLMFFEGIVHNVIASLCILSFFMRNIKAYVV
jgi:hypothetical protein